MSQFKLPFSIIMLAAILGVSCNTDNRNVKALAKTESQALYQNFIEIENEEINYKIPSPMELFIFLEKTNAPFLISNMHQADKINNYPSRKSQAINFGIYAADMAYCAVYGDFQQTLIYFGAVKILAEKLGLHEGYGQTIAERVDKNLNSIDSLMEISADSYQMATQFLENQGQTDILGFILVGGWIEGLYLAIESVEGVDMTNPITERIADQQVLLDNLLDYLHKHESSQSMDEIIKNLEHLQQVFDALYFNDENTLITQNQFVDISNEVKALRNSFINF